MSFSRIELDRIEPALEAFLRKRQPPAHLRSLLSYAYFLSGQSVELLEVRPRWDKPSEKRTSPFAKGTYVRKSDRWKVYWLRGNLRWYSYPAAPEVATIEDFLAVVNADEHHCFFG